MVHATTTIMQEEVKLKQRVVLLDQGPTIYTLCMYDEWTDGWNDDAHTNGTAKKKELLTQYFVVYSI